MIRYAPILLLFSSVIADIYLHNPRGSNNRLDDNGRGRKNGNRLFDSQNNARGGYNVGSLFYYSGTTLRVEWTHQHACSDPNNNCEVVLQYMCHNLLRDGSDSDTIPTNHNECTTGWCDSDYTYGMHENNDYYKTCTRRARNRGLFTADQNMNNRDFARNTRQNRNGNRRGYECPEERDYYPYWHPTPWKDIAVLTSNVERCPYYQSESANVKSRYHCVLTNKFDESGAANTIPNNQQDCESVGTWTEVPALGIAAPECREADWSRANHNGDGLDGQMNSYNWTIPEDFSESCTLRVRYNISTMDYNGWDGETTAADNRRRVKINRKWTTIYGPELHTRVGLPSYEVASQRGYLFQNNPTVQIFSGVNFDLQLAINTAQLGRTFQDRSHSFAIRPRDAELEGKTIHNVNVRGRRGNLVQNYPALEYDFVPDVLEAQQGDYVHFQWTGSNNNPAGAGQGLERTDRSNVVLLANSVFNNSRAGTTLRSYGHWGRNYPADIANSEFLGLSYTDRLHLALHVYSQMGGEQSELDDSGTYFNLRPKPMTLTGIFNYMSTRNNQFTNRNQLGRIIVQEHETRDVSIGRNGGTITMKNNEASITFERNDLESLVKIKMLLIPLSSITESGQSLNLTPASNVVVIYPDNARLTTKGNTFTLSVRLLNSASATSASIYRTTPGSYSSWTSLGTVQVVNGRVVTELSAGGAYVIASA